MKTDNELIAEFMGGYNVNPATKYIGMNLPNKNHDWYDYKDMRYSASWDWLIPVVERIAEISASDFVIHFNVLGLKKQTRASCSYFINSYNKHNKNFEIKDEFGNTLNAVYKAVVKFIKYYNEQKKA